MGPGPDPQGAPIPALTPMVRILPSPRRETAVRLALLVASLLVALLLGELAIRIGIAAGWERLRDPRLYAGWCDDEDQWKLRYRWRKETRDALAVTGFSHHPLFGWVGPERDVDEPLVAPVLLYGDSYMSGVPPRPPEARIPSLVDRLLPSREVINFAAPGYGLDQVYLRFRESYRQYQSPVIVLGIMTLDLDRSLFAVRDAPKPYFELRDGELTLRGTPVPADQAAWHREHPPQLSSYLAAFLLRKLRTLGHVYETEIPYRQPEKKALTRALLEAFADDVHRHHLPHLVVLFYPSWELGIDGWRREFLLQELERLHLHTLDTRPLFLAHGGADRLYAPAPNNHPNRRANRLVAERIAAFARDAAPAAGDAPEDRATTAGPPLNPKPAGGSRGAPGG